MSEIDEAIERTTKFLFQEHDVREPTLSQAREAFDKIMLQTSPCGTVELWETYASPEEVATCWEYFVLGWVSDHTNGWEKVTEKHEHHPRLNQVYSYPKEVRGISFLSVNRPRTGDGHKPTYVYTLPEIPKGE